MISMLLSLLLSSQAPNSVVERFFVGRTEGQGRVQVILSGSHGFRVHSRGRFDPDGTLVLEQRIEEEGKRPRQRTWRLVRSGANRLTGSLSDAQGPVTGEIDGNRLQIRYRSREGPRVEQVISFDPNGRSARNLMIFRQYGLVVARVEESIRRVP